MAYSNSWVVSSKAATINVVTSPTAHDVLIAWAVNDSGTAATFTWPSGFTQIANILTNTIDGQSLGVAIKNDATGSEGSLAISCNQDTIIGGIAAFSGRNNTTPQDVTAVTNTATDAATPYIVTQSMTPVTNGDDIVAICGWDVATSVDGTYTFSVTSGTTGAWATRQDQNDGFRNVGVGTAVQTTAGAITVQASVAGSGSSQLAMVVIALKPAASGATYTLTAAQGAFALTGQIAALKFNRVLSAAQASFSLSGKTVAFVHGYTLTAVRGSFALSGQAANLLFNRRLVAAQGSFALTGFAANLLQNRTLQAGQGSFALSGQNANLLFGHRLTAVVGNFAFSGQPANLVYTPVGGATYTLPASNGSFALTGRTANLLFNRVLPAAVGSFALTGQAANLTYSGTTPVAPSSGGGGGGGWYGQHEYTRKRIGRKVDEWVDGMYADLIAPSMPAEIRKEAAAIVKPFAETKKKVPSRDRVDWAALHDESAAVQSLIALWIRNVEDDEDEEIAFLAMH